MVTRNLVAVQARFSAAPYGSAASFRRYVYDLCERALSELPAGETLLAFPEIIGFPLVFSLADPSRLSCAGQNDLARAVIRREWAQALSLMLRWRTFGLQAFFLLGAEAAYRAYTEAFAGAARDFGVTIQAGSGFLPFAENEPSKGLHFKSGRVYNLAHSFAPTGRLLARHAKIHLTDGPESLLNLSRGELHQLTPVETPVGRLGVAVCLDGFYDSVLAHYDALACEIIVQPSANFASWSRPWPSDPSLSEGDAWLTRGLSAGLTNRLHLRYGVNPMLVGELWGLRAEGRSSIVASVPTEAGAFALSLHTGPDADEEGFVRYSVEDDSRLQIEN